jgi:hypothetical protein
MRIILLLAAMAAPSAMASATEIIRLSDAQREAVLDAAARGPEKQPVLTPEPVLRQSVLDRPLYPEFYGEGGTDAGVRDRKVHGEVSMFAGSGGTFGMSGTAIIPVGETGTAMVSILQGTSNFGGIQGFSLGYASNGLALGGSFGGGPGFGGGLGYGGGFGSWNGVGGNPWAASYYRQPPRGRRIR